MENLTKNRVKEAVIRKMISHAFAGDGEDICTDLTELIEGYYNIAYSVELKDGRSVILKIAPPEEAVIMSYEINIMEAEVEAMRLVRQAGGVPVPQVLFYDRTHTFCNADYYFMTKLPGKNLYRAENEGIPEQTKAKILREAGSYNRRVNEIRGDHFGLCAYPESWSDSWKNSFQYIFEMTLTDGEKLDIDIGMPYSRVRACCSKVLPELDAVTEARLVHWDLWNGNIFIENDKITGLIDFERAIWAEPCMEYFFRIHSVNSDFSEGYGADLRTQAPARAVLYDLYLYLIMAIEPTYRRYPDDSQYKFALKEVRKSVEWLENR